MMFYEFLSLNRIELIERCRRKVARRTMPSGVRLGADYGVPLFLQQLIDTLRLEQSTARREGVEAEIAPSPTEIGRAAALHGNELQRRGYSVDQVVHEYGDICQSVTDLAVERNVVVSADEFRTLNRCLDNAIADAVTAFGSPHHNPINVETDTQHHSLQTIFDEHKRLVDIAAQAFFAIRTGAVGANGTTAILLTHTLSDLRSLGERALREIPV